MAHLQMMQLMSSDVFDMHCRDGPSETKSETFWQRLLDNNEREQRMCHAGCVGNEQAVWG